MDRQQAYIRELFATEDDILSDVVTRTKDITESIQIRPEDGKLLQTLIRLGNIKNIIEIGTLAGYSALWMSRVLPKDGHIHTIEKTPNRHALATETLAGITNVTQHFGEALDILKTLTPKAPFDMIFIDADKHNYLNYLDWAEQNIRQHGLIIADNTLLSGAVYKGDDSPLPAHIRPTTLQDMRMFNQRLADPEKYCSTLLPTPDGMTIAVKLF